MTFQIGGSGDAVEWAAAFANFLAVAVAIGIAWSGAVQTRRLLRESEKAKIEVALISVKMVLSTLENAGLAIAGFKQSAPTDWRRVAGLFEPAAIMIDRALSREIPNAAILSIAVSAQSAALSLLHDAESRGAKGVRITYAGYYDTVKEMFGLASQLNSEISAIRKSLRIDSDLQIRLPKFVARPIDPSFGGTPD